MQAFDPNTSDSSTLVHLGLKKWQVSNMLKYRAKGGKYRKPEDLKKLYGMTDSLYQALAPYIQIATDTIKPDSTASILDSIAHKYPLYTPKKDTIINLRTADTTELKMIRGIGSYRARLIVNYRQRLGGFTSVEQLQEIPELANIVDSISSSFIIDSIIVDPIHVNSASIRYLARHPYLRYEQAKAIYELRRKKIRLHSAKQLESIPGLDSVTIEKLLPYLHFEKKD
jgi:competence ComEA-like helix-hairpin-helix protein